MKTKIHLLIVLSLIMVYIPARAREKAGKDTLYFLVDTAKVPVKDRMVSVGQEGPIHYYSILCKCIQSYKRYPTFTFNEHSRHVPEMLNTSKVKAIHTISLKELTTILYTDGHNFNTKHDIYIIEALPGNKYIKNKVRLLQLSDVPLN